MPPFSSPPCAVSAPWVRGSPLGLSGALALKSHHCCLAHWSSLHVCVRILRFIQVPPPSHWPSVYFAFSVVSIIVSYCFATRRSQCFHYNLAIAWGVEKTFLTVPPPLKQVGTYTPSCAAAKVHYRGHLLTPNRMPTRNIRGWQGHVPYLDCLGLRL